MSAQLILRIPILFTVMVHAYNMSQILFNFTKFNFSSNWKFLFTPSLSLPLPFHLRNLGWSRAQGAFGPGPSRSKWLRSSQKGIFSRGGTPSILRVERDCRLEFIDNICWWVAAPSLSLSSRLPVVAPNEQSNFTLRSEADSRLARETRACHRPGLNWESPLEITIHRALASESWEANFCRRTDPENAITKTRAQPHVAVRYSTQAASRPPNFNLSFCNWRVANRLSSQRCNQIAEATKAMEDEKI